VRFFKPLENGDAMSGSGQKQRSAQASRAGADNGNVQRFSQGVTTGSDRAVPFVEE